MRKCDAWFSTCLDWLPDIPFLECWVSMFKFCIIADIRTIKAWEFLFEFRHELMEEFEESHSIGLSATLTYYHFSPSRSWRGFLTEFGKIHELSFYTKLKYVVTCFVFDWASVILRNFYEDPDFGSNLLSFFMGVFNVRTLAYHLKQKEHWCASDGISHSLYRCWKYITKS